ncbi:hypothetical protein BVY01_00890 [bacterium I07]|nr:hypothetical protein BVY01_00890 [bacterium I07]
MFKRKGTVQVYFVSAMIIIMMGAGLSMADKLHSRYNIYGEMVEIIKHNQLDPPKTLTRIIEWMNQPVRYDNGLQYRSTILKIVQTKLGMTVETIEQDWSNGAWQNVSKMLIQFGDSVDEILSYTNQDWDGSAWVNTDRMRTVLDAQGNITETIFDTWINGQWVTDFKTTIQYDAQGNPLETLIESDTDDDGVLEKQTRQVNTYDAQGHLTLTEDFFWDNGWVKNRIVENQYNAQGQMETTTYTMDILNDGNWVQTSRTNYIYHPSGLLATELDEVRDFATSTMVNHWQTTYGYDAEGNLTEQVKMVWENEAWLFITRFRATYNAIGDMIEEVWDEGYNNVWNIVGRTVYTYDANNNLTEELSQNWSGNWRDSNRTLTTNNNLGFPIEVIDQVWKNAAWENLTRYLLSYPGGGTVVEDFPSQQPNTFQMTNYPNPFNPRTTIEFLLPEIDLISITIYDMQGRVIRTLIHEEQFNDGLHRTKWDGRDQHQEIVPSGIYLYRLSGAKYNMTGRCVLIK